MGKAADGLTRKESERLACLERRRDFLANQIKSGGHVTTWDFQEVSALTWAIDQIRAAKGVTA